MATAYCQVQIAFNPAAPGDNEFISLMSAMRSREVNPFLRGLMMAGHKASCLPPAQKVAEHDATTNEGGG